MSPQPFSVTALSAPGKVLLTGGYLVLDRTYTGTVFALDARIHVVVQQLRRGHRRGPSGASVDAKAPVAEADAQSGKPEGEEQETERTVVVRSPQFVNAVWEYGVQRCENGGGVKVIQKNNGYSVSPMVLLRPFFVIVANLRML
jgi:phosphomevalonate kinase